MMINIPRFILITILALIPPSLGVYFSPQKYVLISFLIAFSSAFQVYFYNKNSTKPFVEALKSNSIFVIGLLMLSIAFQGYRGVSLEMLKVGVMSCIFLANIVFGSQFFLFIKGNVTKDNLVREFLTLLVFGLFNIFLFAVFYNISGLVFDGNVIYEFSTSFYFSIVTWTTLGYGDVLPIEEIRLIAASQALLGYTYMAILIGLILNVIRIESE
ncbi:ion channel [Pseudoalteromonas luteoviolacea]|uniref:ion channel n=1 Tax=Pseudoalteromonas luteoviolacea TaxID=43657 RepID=UPI001FD30576|nr:ion channel [Pseudoalteromonas luteoviolacea]